VVPLIGSREGPPQDGGEDHPSSKEGPRSGTLAEEKEDPHRVENGFDNGNEAGFESGNHLRGFHVEEVRGPDLEDSEKKEGEKAPCSRKSVKSEREAQESSKEVSKEYRFKRRSVFLQPQEDSEECKGPATGDG